MSVTERQRVEVLEDGTLALCSGPRPRIGSLSEGFTSDVELRMSDVVRGGAVVGCRVLARVRVAAPAAPYGTVTVMEKFMAETALRGVRQLLAMVEADALRHVDAGRGALEAAVRENVRSAPALHAYIGFVEDTPDKDKDKDKDKDSVFGAHESCAPQELADDASTTVFYDDRHDDVLRAIEEVKEDIARLSRRLDAAVSVGPVGPARPAPLRVVLGLEPVLLASLASFIAAGTVLVFSLSHAYTYTYRPGQYNRGWG